MSRKPPRRARALSAASVSWLIASQASAFSAVESFRYPAGAAGGGNRYFTGSPAEGYTCKVCHRGDTGPELEIRGLPLRAYRPNVRYEIVVDWPDDLESVAALIEITDLDGRRAGTLALAPDDEIEKPEYCEPWENEIAAAALSLVPPDSELENLGYCTKPRELPENCRQVISLPHCGAKRLRFAWKAPSSDVGPLWFSGGAVRSNEDNDTTGDGATDMSRVLGSESTPNPIASETVATCSAAIGARRASGPWAIVVALVACYVTRRFRRSERHGAR